MTLTTPEFDAAIRKFFQDNYKGDANAIDYSAVADECETRAISCDSCTYELARYESKDGTVHCFEFSIIRRRLPDDEYEIILSI